MDSKNKLDPWLLELMANHAIYRQSDGYYIVSQNSPKRGPFPTLKAMQETVEQQSK